MTRALRILVVVLLLPSLAALPACSRVTNPATGERQFTTLSPEQEEQIGAEQHPLIVQQYGGEIGDPELRAYVDEIGQKLVAVSELPEDDFTFTLLNTDVANAFALPGGYVYITRGILSLAENEAEMAGVLGHEIGHVTARHAAQRQTQATGAGLLATIGTIAAAVLGGETAGRLAQQAAGAGAQAYVASYSRDQELQADELGIRYLERAGYDPRAMATFLKKLNDLSELDREIAGQEGDPAASWFATHPRTLDRVEDALDEIADPGEGELGRDVYLARIDGMIYGDDPSQGLIRERTFIHPELGFAFQAPPGFRLRNTPAAVIGQDREGRTMIFALADLEGRSLRDYVSGPGLRQVAQMVDGSVVDARGLSTFEVDGMEGASASATIRQNRATADIGLAAIDAGERVYRFIFIANGEMGRGEAEAFQETVRSFRRVADDEVADLEPRRIRVVGVDQGQDVGDLARRMDVEARPEDRFLILNELAAADGLEAGERVKLVAR